MSVSSISMIVTSVPKRSKIDANSQPMIPPPRTTSRLGTSVCASSPVESTQRGESSPGIGGMIGYEPVATIALLKLRPISPLSKAIERASSKRPLPWNQVTLFALKSEATPPVICLTTACLPLVRLREVELGLAGDDAELRVDLARRMERVRGRHPGLRRDAADAEARPAELRLPLDAGDARAELRRADRRRVARRAAAEDGDVEFHAARS